MQLPFVTFGKTNTNAFPFIPILTYSVAIQGVEPQEEHKLKIVCGHSLDCDATSFPYEKLTR